MSDPNDIPAAHSVRDLPEEARVSSADHVRAWLGRQRGIILFLICFAVLLGAITYHHWDVLQVSEEAVVRSGVGTDLLDGLTAGRQGLIGSLVWAPLPTLVGLPLVYAGNVLPVQDENSPRLGITGLAWPVLAAAISAFTVVLLNRWLRQAGMHWLIRYPVLLGYQLCPPVLGAVLAGTSASLLLLFAVAGLHFLHHWLTTLNVRSLAYVGTLAALAIVTDWRMIAVVSLILLMIIIRLLLILRSKGFSQAALLIFVVPTLYLVGVWTLTNWLIMGNPVFFLRGLLAGASLLPAHWYRGLAWHLYLLAPVLLFLGLVYARVVGPRLPSVLLAGLVVLAMALVVAVPYAVELGTRRSYLQIYPQQVRTVDEIISFVEDRYPEARVVVSGYYGYVFRARTHRPDVFVHFINLSLPAIDRRTHGKELFLLLPRPEGMQTWEDVYLNHPGLFTGYERYTMHEGSFVAGFVFEERWPADDGQPQWLLLRMILLDQEAAQS